MILTLLTLILHSPFSILHSQDWEARRVAEKGKNPFVSRIVEYKPAPGQFINQPGIGTPEAAESIVGGLNGIVSLGGFGGYIIVGFDQKIWNDPDNPYGIDFNVVGNAIPSHSEPGVVMVMCETGCGEHNGVWYELKGSNHDQPSTIRNYAITYKNPKSDAAADIPWTDGNGKNGTLKKVSQHQQPYYPLPEIFPDYPQDSVSFSGTLIEMEIDEKNPQNIRMSALAYGYADNYPFTGWTPPFLPNYRKTVGVPVGNGGDAFDIDWAVDKDGNPVYLEGIDFIKIYTAVNANAGWLGEISTEVCAVIDVSPDDVLSVRGLTDKPDITLYPNPAADYVNIQFDERQVVRVEIWNTAGKMMYSNPVVTENILTVPVADYPEGVYMVCIYETNRKTVKRMVK